MTNEAIPPEDPLWATDSGATLEPALGQKQPGWVIGQKPPARWQNWWQKNVYLNVIAARDGMLQTVLESAPPDPDNNVVPHLGAVASLNEYFFGYTDINQAGDYQIFRSKTGTGWERWEETGTLTADVDDFGFNSNGNNLVATDRGAGAQCQFSDSDGLNWASPTVQVTFFNRLRAGQDVYIGWDRQQFGGTANYLTSQDDGDNWLDTGIPAGNGASGLLSWAVANNTGRVIMGYNNTVNDIVVSTDYGVTFGAPFSIIVDAQGGTSIQHYSARLDRFILKGAGGQFYISTDNTGTAYATLGPPFTTTGSTLGLYEIAGKFYIQALGKIFLVSDDNFTSIKLIHNDGGNTGLPGHSSRFGAQTSANWLTHNTGGDGQQQMFRSMVFGNIPNE